MNNFNKVLKKATRKKKIVGQMSITNFPLWKMCLDSLADQCDELYLRFDTRAGDFGILEQLKDPNLCNGKIKIVLESSTKWNRWNWREEMIRMLDDIKPDIVISLDQDEIFERSISKEIVDFSKSNKSAMMFSYFSPMPTDNGIILMDGKTYPHDRHMKGYKWIEGLTYTPYNWCARIYNYINSECIWNASTKIKHYCYYTEELRGKKNKELRYRKKHKI